MVGGTRFQAVSTNLARLEALRAEVNGHIRQGQAVPEELAKRAEWALRLERQRSILDRQVAQQITCDYCGSRVTDQSRVSCSQCGAPLPAGKPASSKWGPSSEAKRGHGPGSKEFRAYMKKLKRMKPSDLF